MNDLKLMAKRDFTSCMVLGWHEVVSERSDKINF